MVSLVLLTMFLRVYGLLGVARQSSDHTVQLDLLMTVEKASFIHLSCALLPLV